jgi:hypothetical protein
LKYQHRRVSSWSARVGSVSCDSAKESIIDPHERLRDDDHNSDVGITNVPKKKEK